MKNLTKAFAVIALTSASFATFAATEVNSAPTGTQYWCRQRFHQQW